jgi:dipeptidase D
MKTLAILLLCILPVAGGLAGSQSALVNLLEKRSPEIMAQAKVDGRGDGMRVYKEFVRRIADELESAGEEATAVRIRKALISAENPDFPRAELAWITHAYAREMYRDEIIKETGHLIGFRTFATDVPNRQNPEFIRQKEYLRSLAEKLGLHFNDVDGYVQEIWIGDGPGSFGLMSHSDVQPVNLSEWTNDPWSGEVINGSIWGRGSVDDKGPIVAIMYGMRALLDSGFPLRKKILLLVGTDEESANEDVSTYLKTNAAPDKTIVVDSNYPVICAEKGWCGAWLELPLSSTLPAGDGLAVVSLESGFSPSIVPETATAMLVAVGGNVDQYVPVIKKKGKDFAQERAGAKFSIGLQSDTLVIIAHGKSVHSAAPETGHNALTDLLVFLDHSVKPLRNEYTLMANFASTYIGFELNGEKLGIRHHDSFMGDVTVSANMFQKTDSTVMFMFNFRIPKGISKDRIMRELQSRYDAFGKKHGVQLSVRHYISTPLYNDPEGPFVQRLLGIYNSVTGEQRMPESIGGGTYANRIPNAVVFGPALPDEEYLGHQPDEHFKISTLVKNIEILTHTMFVFGM